MALTDEGRTLAHSLKNTSVLTAKELSSPLGTGKQRRDYLDKAERLEEQLKTLHVALRDEALKSNARIVESIEREIATRSK